MLSTLTARQKQVAQQAFARVLPMADGLGILFYARLFETDPTLRPLFKTQLDEQGHTLMMMLNLCVEGLDEPAELSQALRNLGARHVEYGAREQDYRTMVDTLLWTLQTGLAQEWTEDTADALAAVLQMFTAEMKLGAKTYTKPAD